MTNCIRTLTVAAALCVSAGWAQQRNRIHLPQPSDMKAVEDLSQGSGPIKISDSGIEITFDREGNRLKLTQIQRPGELPILYKDRQTREPGSGAVGNPLSVIVQQGRYKGVYGMGAFHVNKLFAGPRRLLAFIEHDRMPLQISLDIGVEGNVVKWLGQAVW